MCVWSSSRSRPLRRRSTFPSPPAWPPACEGTELHRKAALQLIVDASELVEDVASPLGLVDGGLARLLLLLGSDDFLVVLVSEHLVDRHGLVSQGRAVVVVGGLGPFHRALYHLHALFLFLKRNPQAM